MFDLVHLNMNATSFSPAGTYSWCWCQFALGSTNKPSKNWLAFPWAREPSCYVTVHASNFLATLMPTSSTLHSNIIMLVATRHKAAKRSTTTMVDYIKALLSLLYTEYCLLNEWFSMPLPADWSYWSILKQDMMVSHDWQPSHPVG